MVNVRVSSFDLVLMSIYLQCGTGLESPVNSKVLAELLCLIEGLRQPWIVTGDWNVPFEDMQSSTVGSLLKGASFFWRGRSRYRHYGRTAGHGSSFPQDGSNSSLLCEEGRGWKIPVSYGPTVSQSGGFVVGVPATAAISSNLWTRALTQGLEVPVDLVTYAQTQQKNARDQAKRLLRINI